MLSLMKRKTTPCETRNLRGDTSTLGFHQHKIAVTICARKEQHQKHVLATTTERPAQHSPWNTKTNCPKPSWQQSAFRDKLVATARQHHTNLHNLPHSNWNDIKSTSIRGFASVRWPARQSRCTVTDNVLWNRVSSLSRSPRTPSVSSAATSPMPPTRSDSGEVSEFGGCFLSLGAGGHGASSAVETVISRPSGKRTTE